MQSNGFTDIQLIKGCLSGKVKYQEMLYKRYFSFAMSICMRYAPNKEEAMEITNDSFMKAFDNLNDFDASKGFDRWFAKIIINTAIDNYRKNFKHNSLTDTGDIPETAEDNQDIDQELSANDIIELFAELPDTHRVVFNLYEIEGYTHEEIGKMLGMTTSTSRSYLTRAKKILRILYNKHFKTVYRYHEAF